jgi:hypothetical protein
MGAGVAGAHKMHGHGCGGGGWGGGRCTGIEKYRKGEKKNSRETTLKVEIKKS